MSDVIWEVFPCLGVIAIAIVCFVLVAVDLNSSAWKDDAVNNGVGVFVVDKRGKVSFQWVKPQPTTQAK